MRLHIGVFSAEQLPATGNCMTLCHIYELAAAVVAFARIPFRVLVRHHGAECLQHRNGSEILRSDQLDALVLTVRFVDDGIEDLMIGPLQFTHHGQTQVRWMAATCSMRSSANRSAAW